MGMGGKGGPSGTSTSVQSAEPWGPQQPYLENIFSSAQNLYNNNTPQYYPGTTVMPWTWGQNTAFQGISDAVFNDRLRTQPANALANFSEGDYIWANPAITPSADLAWGNKGDIANQYQIPFIGMNAADSAPGSAALNSYVSGERLEAGNPYLQGVSDSVLAEVIPRVQSQFINSGMLSSPEAARATTAGATSALAPFAFGQYQQDSRNQIDAANALASRYMQGAAMRQAAAGDVANRYLQGAEVQTQGAKNYGDLMAGGFGDMLKAAALAPSVQATQYAPWEALFSLGAADQAQMQNNINDAVQRWNFAQQLPYNQLNQYIGQVTGNYGGTTTLTQPYFNNAGQNALGGALGGAMLGSQLLGPAGLGMASAGTGGALGAGLGALMMLSDPRVKEDERPVGKLDNGMTVYSYRYIDDPPELRRIGLMADEVEHERPDAVARLGDEWGALGGMRVVDYARATEAA